MEKKDIIRITIESAELYQRNLLGKNILIIYQVAPNKVAVMEAVFKDVNFLHLTGICFKKGSNMSPSDFYNRCINHKLDPDSIEIKNDGTTEQKLSVLPLLLTPNLSAKMIGAYKGGRIKLMTNRLAGGLMGSIGFIENGGWYYPNTVLKGDIRDNIDKPLRVLAVFRKEIANDRYEECTYLAKKIELKNLSIPEPYGYISDIQYQGI